MPKSYDEMLKLAFETLYPEDKRPLRFQLTYSGKFSGYNANARMRGDLIMIRMAKNWRPISKEIQVGLIQELLVRLTKRRAHTINMDLYHSFLKKIHIAIPKDDVDPILKESFSKINSLYFNDTIEMPNLRWGEHSTRKLGSYEFGTDTITMSTILHPDHCKDKELMEYVLYHEILHKKFKFNSKAGHTRSHTSEFRAWEQKFPNAQILEKRLSYLAGSAKLKKSVIPKTLFGIRWP